MIKYRGKTAGGQTVRGDLIHFRGQPHIYDGSYVPVMEESVAPMAAQVGSGELYDGDEIAIDEEKAAQVIKDGLLIQTLKATKPAADAKLKVEWSDYRYRLIWKTKNGRVDTGVDMALISPILQYVQVVR